MHRLCSLAPLLLIVPALALADVAVYSWRNADGTMTFTDNPALAPRNAAVDVRAYATSSDEVARTATQREFAHRLAIELGLGNRFTAEQAAEALAEVGITPPLGTWDLDAPMTLALVERLRTLTLAAALGGKIALDVDRAHIAFESAVALVGIKIRDATAVAPESPAETPTAAAPVYAVPISEPVRERVIYVGGSVADPVFGGGFPTIIIDQRIINIDNTVVVRKRAKTKPRTPRTLHRARVPQAKREKPYTAESQRLQAGRHFRQHRHVGVPRVVGGPAAPVPQRVSAGRTLMPAQRVVTPRVVRQTRLNPGRTIGGRSASIPLAGGGYSAR